MKKTSIIIVTYNSSKLIQNLLNSLTLNRSSIHEVIVIENNSADKLKTQNICNKYISDLSIKFILNDNNQGFGKSCNLGANISTGENILFLNPDTQLRTNSIKTLITHKDKESADIIGGKLINSDGMAQASAVRAPNFLVGLLEFSNIGKLFKTNYGHAFFYYKDINILASEFDRRVDAVSGAYLLITRQAFNKLNGFDENMFMYLEDVDLGVRANSIGLKVVYCPHSMIVHIGGASSNNKYKIHHQAWFDSRKYYFKKHFGIITNIIIQPLYSLEEIFLKLVKHV